VPIRDPAKAWRVVRSLRRLTDRYRDDLLPREFWAPGTWHPGPRYVNLYLFVFRVPGPDPVKQARAAAALLEHRRGVRLDWAAGFRSSGAVWLLVKPRAVDAATAKRVHYRPEPEDLTALRAMLRGREREREQDRTITRERR